MFTPTLITAGTTFDLRSQRTASSVRGDATQPVNSPKLLTISHETSNNGRVSSIIMIDDTEVVSAGNTILNDNVRVMFKMQYNPISGRVGIQDTVNQLILELQGLLTTGNITKLLNKES